MMKTAELLIVSFCSSSVAQRSSVAEAGIGEHRPAGRLRLRPARGPRLPTKKPRDHQEAAERRRSPSEIARSSDAPTSRPEQRARRPRCSAEQTSDEDDERRIAASIWLRRAAAVGGWLFVRRRRARSRPRSSASARAGSGRRPRGRRRTSRAAASSTSQWPSTKRGQRGWKRQPLGGLTGLGTSPSSTIALRWRPSSGFGDRHGREQRARVRVLRARCRARRASPISTILPRYITATRSEMCRTTARSCAMKR